MPSYSDVQKAVRVEKFKIWFAWFSGGWIVLGTALATQNVHIVSVITQALLVVYALLATVAAVTMTNRLNRKADAARREVLGDY
ncbi:hypothetical protein DMB38_12830 [Streptomyces sp. WAC 06738]|uniref:hypothetical protein n=1 Tax=Streptomyces sp. WAC 06738 TaxID=2203210 RepID=UPI000F6BEAE4|nr:hypothetical protein [Streptomyces sp. WAC 06738]AZM46581.1 hypothetical protein DMB38_12830 [Streptomyces sp. WAC 06738]